VTAYQLIDMSIRQSSIRD